MSDEKPVFHDVQQGTDAWRMLRAGIPTASQFHRIMTPKRRKLSESRFGYMYHLIAERILKRYLGSYASPAMLRGSELEGDALSWYELQTDSDVEMVGFVTIMNGRIGASPDFRRPSDRKSGEIKCSENWSKHVGWLLGDSGIDEDHISQVQGQMWICGDESVDTIAYHPELPSLIKESKRDDKYIADLSSCVRQFSDELEAKTEECRRDGYMEIAEKQRIERPALPQMPSLDELVRQAAANGATIPEGFD